MSNAVYTCTPPCCASQHCSVVTLARAHHCCAIAEADDTVESRAYMMLHSMRARTYVRAVQRGHVAHIPLSHSLTEFPYSDPPPSTYGSTRRMCVYPIGQIANEATASHTANVVTTWHWQSYATIRQYLCQPSCCYVGSRCVRVNRSTVPNSFTHTSRNAHAHRRKKNWTGNS